MPNKTIQESNMEFSFPEVDLFQIEKCSTYKSLGSRVKMIEMICRKGNQLFFIEAKSSSPKPGDEVKFPEFISEICEKFTNSILLYSGMQLNRPYTTIETLPNNLSLLGTSNSIPINLTLIINGHEKEWLIPIHDKLNIALLALKKTFAIKNIKVINHETALRHKLIQRVITN